MTSWEMRREKPNGADRQRWRTTARLLMERDRVENEAMKDSRRFKACLFVAGGFFAMLVLWPAPVDARYCLHRPGSISQGRCDFSTRQQCMRIASASRGTCSPSSKTFRHSPSRVR
ncbi:MAG: DUF3551 domain-containing protein [Bradyrhizobium sp.]|nr:DUF3551 domain-containing protein [Bradyrhizobium sp.]